MGRKAEWDPRRWSKIDNGLGDNPKLIEIDDPSAMWTYVNGILISAGSMTDGQIMPQHIVRRSGTQGLTVMLRGEQMSIADAFIAQGLWHLPGHDCEKCPQPKAGFAQIHDFHAHQQLKAERAELTSARSASGSKGAKARWDKVRAAKAAEAAGQGNLFADEPDPPEQAPAVAPAMASAMPPAIASAMATPMASAMASAEKAMSDTPEPPAKTAAPRNRRKSRIPAGYPLEPAMREYAKAKLPDIDVDAQHERFVQYWIGKGTPMEDWGAQWRSWMLGEQGKAASAKQRNSGRRGPFRNAGSSEELEDDWASAVGQ